MVKYNAKTKKTTFEIEAPQAQSISLLGEFNEWSDTRHHLKKTKNGKWKIDLAIAPGEYQFLYRVDDQSWLIDDTAPQRANDFGTQNSVCIVPETATKPKPKPKSRKK